MVRALGFYANIALQHMYGQIIVGGRLKVDNGAD